MGIVNINKENKLEYYMNHLKQNIYKFTSINGLIGITLNGGLSRGYGDHLSEIDLTLYLDDKAYNDYKNGFTRIKVGICKIDKELYDIKIVNFNKENKREWSPLVELWDLSYAKILYDPSNSIEKLISNKLISKKPIESIEGIMFSAWWSYKLAGDIWIHREDSIQGHMMLNEAAKSILQSIYLANDEFVPHDKWIANLIGNMKWLPDDAIKLRNQLFSTGDLSLQSLIDRQSNIEKIWTKINKYVIERYNSDIPVDITKKYFYDKLKEILKYDSMPLKDFNELFNAGCLNTDPFSDILVVKDDIVYIDKDKLMELDQNSMYSWHYDILKAVRQLCEKS